MKKYLENLNRLYNELEETYLIVQTEIDEFEKFESTYSDIDLKFYKNSYNENKLTLIRLENQMNELYLQIRNLA